jgi:RND family efflux transporter MFP subunit
MTRNRLVTIAAAVAVVALIAGLVYLRLGKGEADADATPTATITVASVASGPVEDLATVYGVVQADPAGSITVAAPKAAVVLRMLVRSGETVSAHQPLVELANAPGSELAYKQAVDGVNFAKSDLARVQRLFDQKLAATDQLGAAQKALADAEATLAAQEKQGSGAERQVLAAPAPGVVTNVAAANGDHVAQDAALLTLAQAGGAVAKFGVEPTVARFATGQAVSITLLAGGPPISSKLTMVGRAADQTTKTVDAVAPLNGAAAAIGSAVQGQITTGRHTGLTVPRAAVVFDETGPHLFTVSGNAAHRVFVTVGLDQGDNIEVKGPIQAGAQIAVQGAYELQDGMAVKVGGQ